MAGTIGEWQANETPNVTGGYSQTALKAPLASFNFGGGAPNQLPEYLFVLSAGNNGIAVDLWDNSNSEATRWHPAQSPAVLQRVQPLSPITANGAGHVFAFGDRDGVVKEFKVEADGTTWDLVAENVTAS